jgi:hypothetical protein
MEPASRIPREGRIGQTGYMADCFSFVMLSEK